MKDTSWQWVEECRMSTYARSLSDAERWIIDTKPEPGLCLCGYEFKARLFRKPAMRHLPNPGCLLHGHLPVRWRRLPTPGRR